MSTVPSRTILFEMLRSYIALARTLNMSEAVGLLGSTRQTIRRHIDILEETRGEKLFEVRDRQYQLTKAGSRSLREAEAIIARGESWLTGNAEDFDGRVLVNDEGDAIFCAQKHRLSRLWVDPSPLLQHGFQSWADSSTLLESPALASIRPYLVIYRRHGDAWLCVEIGEKSSYSSWFGWTWAKSSVGCFMVETPAGTSYARFISQAYEEVYEGYSVRLDHIHTQMPRAKDGPLLPVSFQRLLLGCTFPDGEFALAVLVDRTYNISISGIDEAQIRTMPETLLMAFDPADLETQE